VEAARVVPPGGGEVVGDSPQRRVEILCVQPGLHATWSRIAPGREGADLHVHRDHSDFFYVLEGELTLRLGVEDEQVALPAGTLARVPPMVAHGFRNASAVEVRYLNFHAPGTRFADYMRGILRRFDQYPPPAEGVRPPSEAAFARGDGVLAEGAPLRVVCGPHEPDARCVYMLDSGTWVDAPAEPLSGRCLSLSWGAR
jgi:mannose-6-phosphate isomerase-like protein (cupin superfamily)